jgi:3-oxoacyl-[acyl-carrier protein] reductase
MDGRAPAVIDASAVATPPLGWRRADRTAKRRRAELAMNLRDKVALITGGSRGVGRQIAEALAAEGMKLALAARSAADLDATRSVIEREHGVACSAHVVDVSDPAQVDAFVDAAQRAHGRIDLLVNNAGVQGAIGELADCAPDDWRRAIEVNLFGTVYATRAVLRFMRAQRSGKIVNFAGGGVGGPNVAPRVSAYTTSKAAVVQFTESMAREVAPYGIQINAISPGAVVTEMTAEIIAAGEERAGRELYQRTLRERASGSSAADAAKRIVVWLASDRSGTLSGKLLAATRDDYEHFDVAAVGGSSLYSVRRIDDALFREVPRS